jgi:ribose transport system substrate-binding protein
MRASDSSNHDPYTIKALVHASKVVAAFRSAGEILRLRDVVARTGLGKALCFRQLHTLHQCGFLEKVGDNQYRSLVPLRKAGRHRIGYATPRDSSFSQEVIHGLLQACQTENLELIRVDNRGNLDATLRNAQRLIDERVELAIEFQDNDAGAPTVASKFQSAGIPLIAVDIPHPGAIYFGANNYEAGLLGGRCLGRYAIKEWQGIVDEILIIETPFVGRVSRMRVDGILSGIGEVFPAFKKCRLVRIDGEGKFKPALGRVRNHLRTDAAKRVLVGAANDPGALGALRAFQEVRREANCAVVGQNAEPEARAEMRQPGTRLVGSVAYFPEKYGEGIVRLALDMLSGRSTPLAVFLEHKLITPQNVDRFYSNDSLLAGITGEYA